MKPYYQDHHITLYNKDCHSMAELKDGSVQCVVTSPPYWGLRKYAGIPDIIFGDNNCEHLFNQPTIAIQGNNSMIRGASETCSGNFAIPRFKDTDMKQRREVVGNTCFICGAWKGQFGLEPTLELYIEHTIEFLREIRRVLRKDGVVFWNIGDSYYGQPAGNTGKCDNAWQRPSRTAAWKAKKPKGGSKILKPKDLCLIPFRVAIAAQEDSWWVRSVIIWSKPNPMPESVTDRPTNSHEYVLMLTKSSKYYWDADAVREKQLPQSIDRMTRSHLTDYDPNYPTQGPQNLHYGEKLSKEEAGTMPGRNIRDVWEFPTQPYPEAHFAVFPEKLPELCIKAATPEDCCSKCGAPWERVREPTEEYKKALERLRKVKDRFPRPAGDWHSQHAKDDNYVADYMTKGWQPTCKCNAGKS